MLSYKSEYIKEFLFRTIVSFIFVSLGVYSFMITMRHINTIISGGNHNYNLVLLIGELFIVLGTIKRFKYRIDKCKNPMIEEVLYWLSLFFMTIAIAITWLFAIQGLEHYTFLIIRTDMKAYLMRICVHISMLYTALVLNGFILLFYFEFLYPFISKLKSRKQATVFIYLLTTFAYLVYTAFLFYSNGLSTKDIILMLNSYTGLLLMVNYISKYVFKNLYTRSQKKRDVIAEVNQSFYIVVFMPLEVLNNSLKIFHIKRGITNK